MWLLFLAGVLAFLPPVRRVHARRCLESARAADERFERVYEEYAGRALSAPYPELDPDWCADGTVLQVTLRDEIAPRFEAAVERVGNRRLLMAALASELRRETGGPVNVARLRKRDFPDGTLVEWRRARREVPALREALARLRPGATSDDVRDLAVRRLFTVDEAAAVLAPFPPAVSPQPSPFECPLAEPASLAELNEFEIAGPPPPDGPSPSIQPLPKESPMPTSERGWEESVKQWVEKGTYVNDQSRGSYRSRVLRVPVLLESAGFRPAPRAPTDYRREHVDALKYRARATSGPNRGRPLAQTTVVPLLSALHDYLSFYAKQYRSVELLELVSDERLWRTRKPEPIRPARSLATPEDAERLLRACDERTRIGFVLGLYSGLRVGEICSVEVRDLELCLDRASSVTVRRGKESKPRQVPIPPVARNVLLSAIHGLPPGARVYPVSQGAFRDDLAAASRRAGLGHVYPHRLRATFITFALRAGAAEQAVMDWAGHNKAETTKGYSDRDPVIEARSRERYEKYVAGGA